MNLCPFCWQKCGRPVLVCGHVRNACTAGERALIVVCSIGSDGGLTARSCPTLFHPVDCSLPGSSVRGFPRHEYWSGLPGEPMLDGHSNVFATSSPFPQAGYVFVSPWTWPRDSIGPHSGFLALPCPWPLSVAIRSGLANWKIFQ